MKIIAWALIIFMVLGAFGNARNAVNDSGKESASEFISALLCLLFAGFGACYLLGW